MWRDGGSRPNAWTQPVPRESLVRDGGLWAWARWLQAAPAPPLQQSKEPWLSLTPHPPTPHTRIHTHRCAHCLCAMFSLCSLTHTGGWQLRHQPAVPSVALLGDCYCHWCRCCYCCRLRKRWSTLSRRGRHRDRRRSGGGHAVAPAVGASAREVGLKEIQSCDGLSVCICVEADVSLVCVLTCPRLAHAFNPIILPSHSFSHIAAPWTP